MGHIVLYNFKTVKSKGVQKILIDNLILKEIKKYKKVLDKYKKENDINNDYFIIKKNGSKYTRNEYTKLFNDIFDDDNKKVSTTMIRKFIASDVWKMDSIKQLASRMQHTPEQALKSYVKI
jgi:protoporphyrinogen oxidase